MAIDLYLVFGLAFLFSIVFVAGYYATKKFYPKLITHAHANFGANKISQHHAGSNLRSSLKIREGEAFYSEGDFRVKLGTANQSIGPDNLVIQYFDAFENETMIERFGVSRFREYIPVQGRMVDSFHLYCFSPEGAPLWLERMGEVCPDSAITAAKVISLVKNFKKNLSGYNWSDYFETRKVVAERLAKIFGANPFLHFKRVDFEDLFLFAAEPFTNYWVGTFFSKKMEKLYILNNEEAFKFFQKDYGIKLDHETHKKIHEYFYDIGTFRYQYWFVGKSEELININTNDANQSKVENLVEEFREVISPEHFSHDEMTFFTLKKGFPGEGEKVIVKQGEDEISIEREKILDNVYIASVFEDDFTSAEEKPSYVS